jgi:electron transfer flavoprotein alpha subunit
VGDPEPAVADTKVSTELKAVSVQNNAVADGLQDKTSQEPNIKVTGSGDRPLRIGVLIKLVPRFDAMELGPDGRLVRDGLQLEMNPYCRRAVTAGVTLARALGGTTTAITLGPPVAVEILREALAGGVDHGMLLTDPAFVGSDTLATALALAAAVRRLGGLDLILMGRNSVDSDTAQVGPQLAELLGVAFLGGARTLRVEGGEVTAGLELDDGQMTARTRFPAVISCAERLCNPCKAPAATQDTDLDERIEVVSARELGPGPWGWSASPTRVGDLRSHRSDRGRLILDGDVAEQVKLTCDILIEKGVFSKIADETAIGVDEVPRNGNDTSTTIGVLVEPGRSGLRRELLGRAAVLAETLGATVTAIVTSQLTGVTQLVCEGADTVLWIKSATVAEDVADNAAIWCERVAPWAMLTPSTMWGREVAGRVAARLRAGLIGDAIDLEIKDGRLIGWKPAFGGQISAAITSESATQIATIRPGVLPILRPRAERKCSVTIMAVKPRRRVEVVDSSRDDDIEILGSARVVVGVGAGVDPGDYSQLEELAELLGADFGATRKVTDRQLMTRARQIGITGRSISPDLYVAIGIAGKLNHMIGVRAAGTILAINSDPVAPVFDVSDVGIVGEWKDAVTMLCDSLRERVG